MYLLVQGWVKKRSRGANEVALRKDLGPVMHVECTQLLKKGILPGQLGMYLTPESTDPKQSSLLGET